MTARTASAVPDTAGPGARPARPGGLDPRGPRFVAGVTAVLLLVTIVLGLVGLPAARTSAGWVIVGTGIGERAADPSFVLLAILTALFGWAAVAGVRRHPLSLFFAAVIRPSLAPPADLEDPAPPRFAQGVGFVVAAAGLLLQLGGVPLALPIAAAAAFVAAFLNVAFGFCLGCELYLLLARLRPRPVARA